MNRALRDDTRKAAEQAIEHFAAHYVRYTEKMTETQRYELLGVHTWHPGHPIEVPGTMPELSPRPGHIRQIILEYKDLGAEHPGKPEKVHGIEIRFHETGRDGFRFEAGKDPPVYIVFGYALFQG
jgi:hypothetical protein